MNYPEATQWGGRVGRYAETSGAVGRCRDPFAGRPVEFEFAFEYEAWLLARFSAATAAITHRRTPVTATAKARELKALATFVVTDRHGRQEYHLASRCEPSGATRVRALRRLAEHTGARVVCTTLTDVRNALELFWRLELLRQAAAIHEGEGAQFDSQILAVAAGRVGRLSRMGERLPHIEPQLLRARLAHLHCRGRLQLDFADDDFGVALLQECLK
jgi:hypothetical protein